MYIWGGLSFKAKPLLCGLLEGGLRDSCLALAGDIQAGFECSSCLLSLCGKAGVPLKLSLLKPCLCPFGNRLVRGRQSRHVSPPLLKKALSKVPLIHSGTS